MIRNYEGSIFGLRQHYLTTFPETSFERIPDDVKLDTSDLHKIQYSVNLLPFVAHGMDSEIKDKYSQYLNKIEKIDTDMMMLIANSEEVAIFNSDPIIDLINYQWGVTGFNFHLVGFVNFFLYMIMLAVYIV